MKKINKILSCIMILLGILFSFYGRLFIGIPIIIYSGINIITIMKDKNRDVEKEREELLKDINKLNTSIQAKETKINDLQHSITKYEYEQKNIINDINKSRIEYNELNHNINELKSDIELEKEYNLQCPKYEFKDSIYFKDRLKDIRDKQKLSIKYKDHVMYTNWLVNDSAKSGKQLTESMIKLVTRCFNGECDNIILKVKISNYSKSKDSLNKIYETINKMSKSTNVTIKKSFLDLKLQELELAYLYACKKQEEKEEQVRIKEQMRLEAEEERKLQAEIEKELKKIDKDKEHISNEIERLKLKSNNDKLLEQINELTNKLNELENSKKTVENRKNTAKAGYVYVISNIGSFGENVYKIGMTRRLEPMDRINELGNASVPFKFDVHAMIFSEDAPKLESDIHKLLDDKRINKINKRKEFFNTTLENIKEVVETNLGKEVEFTMLAEATEYRMSM